MPTNRSQKLFIKKLKEGELNFTALAYLNTTDDHKALFKNLLDNEPVLFILQKIDNLIEKCLPKPPNKISDKNNEYLKQLVQFKIDFQKYYTENQDKHIKRQGKLNQGLIGDITGMILKNDYKRDTIERFITLDPPLQKQLIQELSKYNSPEGIAIKLHQLAKHCVKHNLHDSRHKILSMVKEFKKIDAITFMILQSKGRSIDRAELFKILLDKESVIDIRQKIKNLMEECLPKPPKEISEKNMEWLEILDQFNHDFETYYEENQDERNQEMIRDITRMIVKRDYKKDTIERFATLAPPLQKKLIDKLSDKKSPEGIAIKLHQLAKHCVKHNLRVAHRKIYSLVRKFNKIDDITFMILQKSHITEDREKLFERLLKKDNAQSIVHKIDKLIKKYSPKPPKKIYQEKKSNTSNI